VEDHADLAEATASQLRAEDFEVQTAVTGREALEVAPDFRPQLIIKEPVSRSYMRNLEKANSERKSSGRLTAYPSFGRTIHFANSNVRDCDYPLTEERFRYRRGVVRLGDQIDGIAGCAEELRRAIFWFQLRRRRRQNAS
jgi:hypothetical protein